MSNFLRVAAYPFSELIKMMKDAGRPDDSALVLTRGNPKVKIFGRRVSAEFDELNR